MKYKHSRVHISKFISNVCKGRTEDELKEAEENFTNYLLVVKDICERLYKEGKTEIHFDDS